MAVWVNCELSEGTFVAIKFVANPIEWSLIADWMMPKMQT